MVIDDYKWVTIHKAEKTLKFEFIKDLLQNSPIGIVSEAGCPGIADPGQVLVSWAQEKKAVIRPLAGPSSVLLSLMASGFNGQQFCFNGYLPIDNLERTQMIKELENRVQQKNITQIFIETPYRNNQLLSSILKSCTDTTLLCIAVQLTGIEESVQTKTVSDWKKELPDLHKKPCIFLLGAC
jgi:16S rRNA (cytidine1402-2'-O)-methyltransferase